MFSLWVPSSTMTRPLYTLSSATRQSVKLNLLVTAMTHHQSLAIGGSLGLRAYPYVSVA
ncbi:hypothetical protein ACJQWK_09111 [Exserohilum turcicum]